MNPWPTYEFLKSLSGMENRSKEEIKSQFEQIINMPQEDRKEGCAEFSIMFVHEI